MAIITVRIPREVKEAFDKAFEGEDKDAVIAALLREALEERAAKEKAAKDEPKRDLVAEFRNLRESMPALSNEGIRKAREEGRP